MGLIVATDLSAIRRNVEKIKAETGKSVMLMVKCDAYGRGMEAVSEYAESFVEAFGVATATEGAKLRACGIKKPILVTMFEDADSATAVKSGLDVGIYSPRQAYALEVAAKKAHKSVNAHIAVNTGMNRLGVSDEKELEELLSALSQTSSLTVKGVYTHFYGTDDGSISLQNTRFKPFEEAVKSRFGEVTVHTQNSGAIFSDATGSLVRVGLAAYGDAEGFVPSMSVYGRIIAVNHVAAGDAVGYGRDFVILSDSDVAVVSGGYGDGVGFKQKYVLVNGKKAKVVCNPCMDVFMIDVTKASAEIGDLVTIVGRSGKEEITLSDVAKWSGTSPYAAATAFGGRIDRIYLT